MAKHPTYLARFKDGTVAKRRSATPYACAWRACLHSTVVGKHFRVGFCRSRAGVRQAMMTALRASHITKVVFCEVVEVSAHG